jgi:hypothetical protein
MDHEIRREASQASSARVLSNIAQDCDLACEGICMDRDPDEGRQVYSILRDLLTGVVLLILTVQIEEIRLPGGGAATSLGVWLSVASAYFAYRAALYLTRGEKYP